MEKGLAGLLGCGCSKGKKDELSPSAAPEERALGHKSQPRCLQAALSTSLPARQGSQEARESGKIGIEGEGIHLKASPLVCKALKHHLRATGRKSGELSSSK